MWYVYLLKLSEKPWFYVGYSEDLRLRVTFHINDTDGVTKNKNPRLVFFQACDTPEYAIKKEEQIKKMGTADKIKLISEFGNVVSLIK